MLPNMVHNLPGGRPPSEQLTDWKHPALALVPYGPFILNPSRLAHANGIVSRSQPR
jgi:hypothetical protein